MLGLMNVSNSSPQSFEVLSWRDGFERHRKEWNTLATELEINPSLRPEWTDLVLQNENTAAKSQILVGHRGGRLTSVMPFSVSATRMSGIPVRLVDMGSNAVSYHAEIIASGERVVTLAALLDRVPGWDVINIANVEQDGASAQAIQDYCQKSGARYIIYPVDYAPYVEISGSWDDFIAQKGKKFRYKLRKRHEAIATGALSVKWYRTADQVDEFIAAMLSIETRSWKAIENVEVNADNREGRYYQRLLHYLAENSALQAVVLSRGDEAIAYSLCCNWGNWMGQMKTAFDVSTDSLSPGSIVIDESVKAAFSLGAEEFDFLGTPGKSRPEPHKLFWTKAVRHHVSYYVFAPRILPSLLGLVKQTKLRIDAWRSASAS